MIYILLVFLLEMHIEGYMNLVYLSHNVKPLLTREEIIVQMHLPKQQRTLKIDEVINCGLHDGNFVLINHPPRIHQHSLHALKVYMHLGSMVIISPLICGPFGVDFDGDCIHVFIPNI